MLAALVLGGCTTPEKANILVRKQNAELREKLAETERLRAADRVQIETLESQRGTLPTLPHERLNKLFTAHGIQFGKLTGSGDLDRQTPGDEGLKVYITPIDDVGDVIKAAGSFTVDLFDLDVADKNRIGRWEFDAEKSRAAWFSAALIHSYVLECPWQTLPRHKDLTVRVTFKDELTQRTFTAQRQIKLAELPITQSATQPSANAS
jgi:hypothetical protein